MADAVMNGDRLRVPLTSWQRWGLLAFALLFAGSLWLVSAAFGTLGEDNREYERASITLAGMINVQRETLLIIAEAGRHVPHEQIQLRRSFLRNQLRIVRERTSGSTVFQPHIDRFEEALAELDDVLAAGADYHAASFTRVADEVELAAKQLYDRIEADFLAGLRAEATDRGRLRLALALFGALTAATGLWLAASVRRRLRTRFLAAYRDLANVNDELVRAGELKDQFLSMVSHELRTPLAAVIGFSLTLRRYWPGLSIDQREDFLDRISAQAERQQRLIDNLLDASVLRQGRISTSPVDVTLGELLDRCLPLRGTSSADVRIHGQVNACVRVDPDHLQQLITNFVENASKYGAPPIDVHIRVLGEVTEIAIRDHGPGVPDDFIAVMWDPFTQSSHGDRRTANGTGLGLAIAHALARANGGSVSYETASPGARFTIRLPSGSASGGEAPTASNSEAPPSPFEASSGRLALGVRVTAPA